MTYTFPSTIKAARISTFISTAAWIQSAAAVPVGDVWLPEEALSNFLSRHTKTARADVAVPAVNSNNATNPAAPRQGAEDDEDEEHDHADGEKDEEEEESSADSSVGDAESLDSSKSSDSDSGSTAKGEKDGVDALPGGTIDNNTAGGAISASPAQDGGGGTGDPLRDGIAAGTTTSSAPAGLSPGAQAAIAVWVVIGVVAAGVAFWWFRRRRQRQKKAAMQGSGSDTASSFFSFMGGNGGSGGRDPEGARTQPMAAQGAMPSILPTPMDPAAFMNRPLSRLSGNNNNNADYVMRAQPGSGPDYNNNDGIPFGADSQSWRQSPPPGAYSGGLGGGMTSPGHKRSDSRVGLPSNPRPGSQREMVIGSPMMNGPSYRRGGDQDTRTVITDGTESTIFNWR